MSRRSKLIDTLEMYLAGSDDDSDSEELIERLIDVLEDEDENDYEGED